MKNKIYKLFFWLWIISIVAFVLYIIYSNIPTNPKFPGLAIGIVIFGCVAFAAMILTSLYESFKKNHKKSGFLKFCLLVLFFPFLPLLKLVKYLFSKKRKKKDKPKLFNVFFILVFVGPFWLLAYILLFITIGYFFGFYGFKHDVTGKSMSPTFQDSQIVGMNHYNLLVQLFNPIKRGEIVVFKSGNTIKEDTNELVDYVKRVIAIPGDNLEIRGGYVYLNNQIVDEIYTLAPRSTYGNTFLPECKSITIPKGYVLVLGDNRKNSKDSREIGLIDLKSINSRLPLTKQSDYKAAWREEGQSIQDVTQPSFDFEEYLEKLNNIRSENKIKTFKHNSKLDEAAKLRAEAIITYDERNIKPKDSQYPIQSALKDANYFNTVFGEVINIGYFEAQELLDNWLAFETKNNLLNPDYQETGLAAVVGKIDNCEVQVIVQEFGGYIPPNYKQTDIEAWEQSLNRLREILPSWENIRNSSNVYPNNKDKAERIIQIINIRISRIQVIVNKMRNNQWLSSEENQWTREDQALYNEQENLGRFLNSQKW